MDTVSWYHQPRVLGFNRHLYPGLPTKDSGDTYIQGYPQRIRETLISRVTHKGLGRHLYPGLPTKDLGDTYIQVYPQRIWETLISRDTRQGFGRQLYQGLPSKELGDTHLQCYPQRIRETLISRVTHKENFNDDLKIFSRLNLNVCIQYIL